MDIRGADDSSIEVDIDPLENQLAEITLEGALFTIEGFAYTVEYDQDRDVYVATPLYQI